MFALLKIRLFSFKNIFERFKVSQKSEDPQFPEDEPFYFPSNFETKQDIAKYQQIFAP